MIHYIIGFCIFTITQTWVITHQDLREVGASFLPTNWKLGDYNPFSRITSDCQTTYFEIHNGETIKKQFTINYVQFSNIRIELNLYFFNMVDSQVIISINGAQIYSNNFLASHYPTQSTLCSGPAYQYLFRTQFAITTKPVNQTYQIQLSYTQLTTSASAYLGIRDLVISTDSPTSTNGCPMEYPVLGVNGECQQYCIGTCYEINAGYCSSCCPCPDITGGVNIGISLSCYKNNDYDSDSYCSIYCDSYQQQLRGPFLDQCIQPSITSSVYRDPLIWYDNSLGPKTPDSNYQDLNLEKYLEFSSSHASTVDAAIYSDTSINPGYILQLQGSIYIIGTWEVGSYVEITLFCDSEISLFKIESDGTKFTTSNGIATQEVSLTLFDSTTITAKRVQIQVQGYDGDGGNYILLYQNLLGTTASYALSQFYTIRALKNDGTCQSSVLENHCISCYSPLFAYLGGCVSECPTHSIVSTSNRNCTDYKDSETVSMFPFLTTNGIGTYLLKAFNDLTFDDTTIGTIFPSSPCIADNCLNSQRYSLLPTMKMFGGYNSWGKGSYSKSWSGLQTHYQIRIYFKLYFIDSWTNSDSFTISIDGVQYAQESILGLTGTQIAGTSELDYMKSVFYRIPHSASTLSIEFLCIDSESGSGLTASCGITDLYVLWDQDITPLCPTDEYYSFYTNTCRACAGVCSTLGCILFETNCKCHYSCKTCTGSGENQCSSCDPNKHRVSGVTGYCNCDTNNYTVVGQNCVLTVGCHYSCQYCFEAANQNSCATCPNPGTTFRQSGSNMDCVCATGYYDNGAQICIAPSNCHHSCASCSTDNSITDCLTCPPSGNNRTTGSATSCPCDPGYEDTGAVLCTLIACHHSCATCSIANSENGCLTCPPPGNNRSTGSATTCPCDPGYEDTGAVLCTLPIICHHSCATCTVADSITSCLTCPPPGNNRTTGSATSCPCDPGYEDTGAVLCTLIACHYSCATCSIANSENGCLTCPPPGNNRSTGSATTCPCDPGYEDTGAVLCTLPIICHHSCATCTVADSITSCLTCPASGNNRTTGQATSCPCDPGYEDTGVVLCTLIACHHSCDTCSIANSENNCLTCPVTGNHRTTDSANSCPCDPGYEDTGYTLCTLILCHHSCATCSIANSENNCLTCPETGNYRATGSANSCPCDPGYEDTGSITCDLISPCDVSCSLCSVISSSTDCVTCPPTSNRVLSGHTCLCVTGYQETSPIQQNCIPICHYSCLTCSLPNSSSSCVTCPDNATSHRTKTGTECLCDTDYSDDGSIQNCTFVCDSTCLTCTAPGSSSCSSCDGALHRIDGGNNDCVCKDGYHDISGSCEQITPCHVSCLLCSLVSSSNSCVSCDASSHRALNTSSQCLCDPGYEDNSNPLIGTCSLISCHYSCLTCSASNSSTSCLTCPDPSTSYRLPMAANICSCQSNYAEVPGEVNCQPICHFTCESCSLPNSSTNCYTCPDQSTSHRIPGSNNDCPCESGYLSIPDQVNCQIQCHYSCLTCSLPNSFNSCLTCPDLSSSHRSANYSNQCPCITGYKEDNNSVICISDCHYSCSTCSQSNSASQCLSCPVQSISYRIVGRNNTCICQDNYFEIEGQTNCSPICYYTCLTCLIPQTSNSCLSCDGTNSHRILSQNNECVCEIHYLEIADSSICVPICHQNCSTCFGIYEYQCLTCFEDTKRLLVDNKCICGDGYYEIVGQVNCQIQCMSLCKTCDTHSTCLTCKLTPNIVFQDSQCICQSKYYESNGECLACISPCDECSSESICLTCVDFLNRYLINGECQCKQYYWDVDGQLECISCDQQNGWLSKKCTKTDCNDGHYTYGEDCDDDNSDPRDGCLNCKVQKGFFCTSQPLQKSVCIKCGPNCEDCEQDGQCKACQTGYEVDQSGFCVSCPDNCESCNNHKCQKCIIIPNITFANLGKDCPICEDQPGAYSNSLNLNECQAKCGDLITFKELEECDDGNTLDSDGCSSTCKIEKGFVCLGSQCIPSEPPYPILTSVTPTDNYTDFRKYYLNYSTFILNDGKMADRISIQIQNKSKDVDYRLNVTENILEQDSKDYCNYSQIIEMVLLKSFEAKSIEVKFTDINSIVGINGLVQEVTAPQQPIYDYYYQSEALIKATNDVKSVNEITLYILLGMVGLAILIGGLDTFWNLLDLVQLLSYTNFIDTRYPYNLSKFLELFEFGQLRFLDNIIKTETILSLEIDSSEWDQYQPKGIFSTQVDSSLFLINASSTITAFIMVIGIYILFNCIQAALNKIYPYLIKKYQQNFSISIKVYKIRNLIFRYTNKYCNSFFWSVIIRTHMSTVYDITFAIFLQFQLSFIDMKSVLPQISYISSCGALVAQGIIVYFYVSKLNIIKAQSKQKKFQNSYGEALYENLKIDKIGSMQTYYNVFLVSKRFIYMAILITVSTVPQIQTICMSILGSIHIAFIISKRPLDSTAEFVKQLQCEILMVLMHLKICLLTIDDCINLFSEDGRIFIGWLCVGEVSLIIAIQLLIDISQQIIYIYSNFKGVKAIISKIRGKCFRQGEVEKMPSIH